MEFKRYWKFLKNENTMDFYTYLPIQLDATCNGFQHLALSSDERKLFTVLNLIVDDKEKHKNNLEPHDFMIFLLHKIIKIIKDKLYEDEIIDKKRVCSYERLINFVWERSYVKPIMTIPYNTSFRSMRDNLSNSLVNMS